MTERTRGEVISEIRTIAWNAKTPADIVHWLKDITLPYFKNDFGNAVSAIIGAGEGPVFQSGSPSVGEQIAYVTKINPNLGAALSVVAMQRDIRMINEEIKPVTPTQSLTEMPIEPALRMN